MTKVDLETQVQGILSVVNGGTGTSSPSDVQAMINILSNAIILLSREIDKIELTLLETGIEVIQHD